ncbi:aspartate--tRNA ligase [Bacteroidia bacterium]|nr:aspartate--tRNA ligase [Bacteroidia bacterium]
MYRTHTCGQLRLENVNKNVCLAGWVQKVRNLGAMTFIDLRDRYGITQLVVAENATETVKKSAATLGREFVVQVYGKVVERASKNTKIPTGDVEVLIEKITLLNRSDVPPFTIEDESDGGDELRMKYRYLDLRRKVVRQNLELRHRMGHLVRNYLDTQGFMDVETPVLIKGTPEGARDFIVPSRMNQGQFYALPQSPQLFKQLLMVAGFDRYYQLVKCFRDEDLRADRQPEFTQIDCEMSFVEQEDVLGIFEGMMKHLFKELCHLEMTDFPRMTWHEAMELYGCDKPDLRFDMKFTDLTSFVKGHDFPVFEEAEYVGAICATGCAEYTRKQLDELTEFVKRSQIGAKGLIYVRYNADGSLKSSVDKFYEEACLKKWAEVCGAKVGDLMLLLAGGRSKTLPQLSALRLEMGERLGLRSKDVFKALWIVDFPLLEWDEETQRFYAMHHPFTAPKTEDIALLETNPSGVRANAYDMVINGVEVGGGSIRIHDSELQSKMFTCLGFTKEEAEYKFGFLLNAFKYGAPPHGGIAFGFDRLVSLFAKLDSIRDTIAFPKNNSGRDVMNDAPSLVDEVQLKELGIKTMC